jgi:hypothetical protein
VQKLSRWWVQKLVVLGANASPGAKTRAAHQPRNFCENFLCARRSSRREDSIGIDTSALNWVVVALWGGGEKRLRLFIESPMNLGLYSPSRHHQRRLRPPACGTPGTQTQDKVRKQQRKTRQLNTFAPLHVISSSPPLLSASSSPLLSTSPLHFTRIARTSTRYCPRPPPLLPPPPPPPPQRFYSGCLLHLLLLHRRRAGRPRGLAL